MLCYDYVIWCCAVLCYVTWWLCYKTCYIYVISGLLKDDEQRRVICRDPIPEVSQVLHPKQDGPYSIIKDGFLLFF